MGHAIRHAIALGLHLRVGAGINVNELQLRSRTWWALYGLEQLLGDFTGRPTSILGSDIATPLDWSKKGEVASPSSQTDPRAIAGQKALPKESSTGVGETKFFPRLYFICRTRLSIIGHKIRSSLYASGRVDEPWSKFQQSIRDFDQELTRWSANLPESMRLPPGIDFLDSCCSSCSIMRSFMGRSRTALTYLCPSHAARALYTVCKHACYIRQSISPAKSPVEGGYSSRSSNAMVPPGAAILGNRGHEASTNPALTINILLGGGTDGIPPCWCR